MRSSKGPDLEAEAGAALIAGRGSARDLVKAASELTEGAPRVSKPAQLRSGLAQSWSNRHVCGRTGPSLAEVGSSLCVTSEAGGWSG